MAGSSASGRSPPPDGRATGKSGLGPLEAWWKHEGENRCAIPTDRAKPGRFTGIGKRRKLRKNSRFRAIVHGSFDTTHNLKVVGSNPTPATNDTCETAVGPKAPAVLSFQSAANASIPARSPLSWTPPETGLALASRP